ncbi:hypothetical protein MTR67_000713 [Solanum verrucosum]|uniref:Uncharacterized protein n=1 Tax=Solanum verrucosum TaxID=315347 RepID=A0AAF0T7Q5_SOLVR|nr:hypothetical protein MTR67_000713 [Solanum verrucosum]
MWTQDPISKNPQQYNIAAFVDLARQEQCAYAGAYLNLCGEVAALPFMKWLWLHSNFVDAPMPRHFPVNPEKLVNVWYFESLLHYKFNYPSVLVEALTQGSYMLLEIPR